MPTKTYKALANVTLSSATANVTFSSIPATYRDLVLIISSNNSSASARDIRIQFNIDTGSNYSRVVMLGDGSSATSGSSASLTSTFNFGANKSTEPPAVVIINIMDYSATDKHKTILNRGNVAGELVLADAHRWADTSAITSMKLFVNLNPNFTSGSTFSLYGIEA